MNNTQNIPADVLTLSAEEMDEVSGGMTKADRDFYIGVLEGVALVLLLA